MGRGTGVRGWETAKGKAKDEFLGGPFVQGKSLRTRLMAGSEISEHQGKFVPFLFSTFVVGSPDFIGRWVA